MTFGNIPIKSMRALKMAKTAVIVIIVVVFFLFLARVPFTRGITGAIISITKPVSTVLVLVGDKIKKTIATPFRAEKTRKELEDSRAYQRQLIQENARLLELKDENENLRRELNFYEHTHYPIVAARVIGRTRENGILFLILNRGSDDRIMVGQPVVVDGTLIGKIIKTQNSASVLAPLTAAGVKTAATFAGSEKTSGIMEGELNVNLVMRLIPKDTDVRADMPIITSGLEEYIPRGLVIGTVERVESNPQDLFQTAYLNALIRLDEVNIASIITSPLTKD